MDFIGIGPLEIVLILVLAFLFLGPEKLPGIAARAGKIYRNFKQAASDITKTVTEEIATEQKTITEDLSHGKTSLTEDLSNLGKTITEDLSPEPPAGDSKTTGKPRVDTIQNRKRSRKTTLKPKSNERINE
jgi:sec-independent protein translocase protein TatB